LYSETTEKQTAEENEFNFHDTGDWYFGGDCDEIAFAVELRSGRQIMDAR
jgi:hypothetical protein